MAIPDWIEVYQPCKPYRCVDWICRLELKRLGLKRGPIRNPRIMDEQDESRAVVVMAIGTSEFRQPKAGEWFLSGSPIEAYKAENDLSTAYRIARLVVVERVETFRIIRY